MGFFGDGFIFWVLGIIAAISLVVGYLAKRQHDKRWREMSELAVGLGFDYYPEGLAKQPDGFFESLLLNVSACPLIDQLVGFEPFGSGYGEAVDNLLVKQQDGLSIYVMDYYYKTRDGSGKNESERTHRYTVVAIRHGLIWPHLRLSPEGFAHKVGKMFGMKDLSFESEEFNQKYFVSSNDEKSTYDILHPQCIDLLLRLPAREWQAGGMYLLVYESGYMSPQGIRRVLQDMHDFISLVPDYVRQDRGFEPKWTGALDF
ncbi:MAG: hypothetical protein ABIV13_03195 [Fimbriimonadales bacterium]